MTLINLSLFGICIFRRFISFVFYHICHFAAPLSSVTFSMLSYLSLFYFCYLATFEILSFFNFVLYCFCPLSFLPLLELFPFANLPVRAQIPGYILKLFTVVTLARFILFQFCHLSPFSPITTLLNVSLCRFH